MTTFWEIAAHSVDHMFSLYFDNLYYKVFPALVLRAGFGFWLLQFLTFADIIFLSISVYHVYCVNKIRAILFTMR